MRNIFQVLVIALLSCFTLAHAGAPSDKTPDAVVEAYLKIQESLAGDSLDGAKEGASALAKATHEKGLAKPATEIGNDADLKSARNHFKALSKKFLTHADLKKRAGTQRVYCSMAKASWLQKEGPIANPYYGKEMLECGEVEK